MILTDRAPANIGHCDECGAPHDNGSRLDHCAECGNCFDHCMCETVREEAERAWSRVSDRFAALPSPSARRAARPPRWR
jgi:predicted amidophosphoribosyltransferase